MIRLREMNKDDVKFIKDLTDAGIDTIINAYNNSTNKMVIEDDGIKGFAIIRPLGDINELSVWHVQPEHSLLLKAIVRKTGALAAAEREENETRIRILECAGFRKQSIVKGVFSDSRAVMLRTN